MSMLLICVSAVNLNKHFFQLKIGLCLLSKSQDHSGQNKFTNPKFPFQNHIIGGMSNKTTLTFNTF